jgi:hypothetical protein
MNNKYLRSGLIFSLLLSMIQLPYSIAIFLQYDLIYSHSHHKMDLIIKLFCIPFMITLMTSCNFMYIKIVQSRNMKKYNSIMLILFNIIMCLSFAFLTFFSGYESEWVLMLFVGILYPLRYSPWISGTIVAFMIIALLYSAAVHHQDCLNYKGEI